MKTIAILFLVMLVISLWVAIMPVYVDINQVHLQPLNFDSYSSLEAYAE
jgi:hypothetical protein